MRQGYFYRPITAGIGLWSEERAKSSDLRYKNAYLRGEALTLRVASRLVLAAQPLLIVSGLVFLLLLPVPNNAVHARSNDSWIDRAPTVAQVFKEVQGTDEIDTPARQDAALTILRYAIQTWTGQLDVRGMDPRAAAKFLEYTKAARDAPFGLKFNDGNCSGATCTRLQFFTKEAHYQTDIPFIRATLSRWFSPDDVQAQVNWEIRAQRPPPQEIKDTPPLTGKPAAPENTSKAFQQSRTALFWWETRMPTVAQVNADTAGGSIRDQAIVRAAAFSVLLDVVLNYATTEDGPFYVPPPQVKEKDAAYVKAVRDSLTTAESDCPKAATCVSDTYLEKDRLRGDSEFKQRISMLYFGTPSDRALAQNKGSFVKTPPINWNTVSLYGGGGLGLAFFLWLFMRRREPPPDPIPPLSDNFGSASYAPMELKPRHRGVTASGVFLGRSSEPERRHAGLDGPGAPMVTTEENHTLIVAATRTGKGTRVIVPTLLRYAGNMFVIDPKGENTAITARARRAMNQTVLILNPWGLMDKLYAGYGFKPATYNPLDILDPADPNIVADARRLANAICPVTGNGDSAYWQQSGATILTAVFLWLAVTPGEKKTLARARDIVTLDRKELTDKFFVKMAVSEAFQGAIAELARRFIELPINTYGGVTSTLQTATDFISDMQLKNATNGSTFSMNDLRDKPTTLYLIPPDEIDSQVTWLRLMIAAATRSFRRPVSPTPPIRTMMLIDEFASLGKLQDLPTDIAKMAGYGLDYTLIVQGIDQLKSIYKDDKGTILSNCVYKWFCNVNDLDSARLVSESLGEATVRTRSKGFSAGSGGGGSTQGESDNYGEKGRRLLTPDEVMNIGKGVAIAFQPDGLPMYLKPIDYWDLTKAFDHLANEYPELYWQPPLTYDENPWAKKKSAGGAGSQGQSHSRPPPRGNGRMTRAEALKVFDLPEDADEATIRAAYKRLMSKVHPDVGGTNHFAKQLNEAREVLLG
jgi:type IV secretion system protein VirD4